jgi:hypothetical protein
MIEKLRSRIKKPRHRTVLLIGGSILALSYQYFTDPNGGALTAALVGQLVTPIIAVWFAFLSRKALFDYLDVEELYNKAKESAVGAGLIYLGVAVVMFGLLGLFGNQLHAQTLPANAPQYLPLVKNEQITYWKDHPMPFTLQGSLNMSPAYQLRTPSAGILRAN